MPSLAASALALGIALGSPALGSPPPDDDLSHGDILRVVTAEKPGVSARCWQAGEPAPEARARALDVASVRVRVSLVIEPSGQTSDVVAKPDDARFDDVGRCVAAAVRGWRFRASRGRTRVNVPFAFAPR